MSLPDPVIAAGGFADIVRLEGVQKLFGAVHALRNIDLRIGRNEIVRRAYLGVVGGTRPLPPALARDLGRGRGLEVVQLLENSPAARAGVRPSDLIVELDGRPIEGVSDLQRTLVGELVGRLVELGIGEHLDPAVHRQGVRPRACRGREDVDKRARARRPVGCGERRKEAGVGHPHNLARNR